MAKKVVTTTEYIDDLDGGKANRTVSFSFDETSYEIDLSKKNIAVMTKAVKPYVEAARKVRGTQTRKASTSRSARRTDLAEVRAWATANGLEVSGRGRVSAAVLEAYDAAK